MGFKRAFMKKREHEDGREDEQLHLIVSSNRRPYHNVLMMRWFVSVLSLCLLSVPAAAQPVQDGEADRLRPATTLPSGRVAVLPFENLSQAPADEWLGVGIAETVTAVLSAAQGLTVVGCSS